MRIALAKTKDFVELERISLITEADYRNVVIFPEKFNGLYARLDRPHSEIAPRGPSGSPIRPISATGAKRN